MSDQPRAAGCALASRRNHRHERSQHCRAESLPLRRECRQHCRAESLPHSEGTGAEHTCALRSATARNEDTEPVLGKLARETLQALHVLKATSQDSRKTSKEIAAKVGDNCLPDNLKRPLSLLKKCGLVAAISKGRDGGYWLTAAGGRRAEGL